MQGKQLRVYRDGNGQYVIAQLVDLERPDEAWSTDRLSGELK